MTSLPFGVALLLAGMAGSGLQPAAQDLKKLTIEELMEIDVTLATRSAEPVGTTAAAISVITRDEIRRSGVTTIADALQLADGVQVARFNTSTWAITARGFNSNVANKLLVMVDGRTEYSPLFSGVFWNMLDYVLDDIERIEVIRGPGATLWGANAVNGVVNIVTRHARDTQGTYASVGAGNEDPFIAEVRHGDTAGSTAWRVYGKVALRDDQKLASGASADDARRRGQVGFRLDGGAGPNTWLIKGDAFHSRDDLPDRSHGEWTEIAVQARWARALSARSHLQLQSYYRREYRNIERQLTHHLDTLDVDLQHALEAGAHHVVWGFGARSNRDQTYGSPVASFDPASRSYPVFSVFAQDEIALVPRRVDVTAGIKLEHNAFSGAHIQPNLRARWRLPHRQLLWGAVSHAVRRPTRFDDDIVVGTPAGVVLARGSDDFKAESLIAFEVGYRVQPSRIVAADVALFAHRYTDLRSQEAPPTGGFPLVVGNTLRGRSNGMELGLDVQPVDRWRTHIGFTWLDVGISRQPGSRDVGGGASDANDPGYLFGLRTSVDLAENVELDARLRSVGSLPNPVVPAYTELGLRLGWRATPRLELALVGEDLLHAAHPEFGPAVPGRVLFERGVRAVVTMRLP